MSHLRRFLARIEGFEPFSRRGSWLSFSCWRTAESGLPQRKCSILGSNWARGDGQNRHLCERLLLLLANFGEEGKPQPILADINQETLADMIGATRSRVSFFLNKFRRLGFIDYNGHLTVHSSLLSVVLHDDPRAALSSQGHNFEESQE
jgi:hypothetical protein